MSNLSILRYKKILLSVRTVILVKKNFTEKAIIKKKYFKLSLYVQRGGKIK